MDHGAVHQRLTWRYAVCGYSIKYGSFRGFNLGSNNPAAGAGA